MLNSEVGMRKSEIKNCQSEVLRRRSAIFPHSAFRLPTCIVFILIFAPWNPWTVATANVESGILSASLDQESVPVGGVVWLTLDYRLPEGGRLPEKPEVKGLERLSLLEQIIETGQIRIKLLVDQVGPWRSGPISLNYLDSEGQLKALTADPVSLQVGSNLGEKPEEAQLRPIRDIIPIQSLWRSYLFWTAVIIAIILIGAGFFWWYNRRRMPAALAEYLEPPDVRARRELRGLETQRYFEKGLVKKYYFVFSEILRRYLESIRNFPAAEFTTEEIAQHIKTEQDRKLIPLLQQADLVKFADYVPTLARKEEDIKVALAYIRETGSRDENAQGNRHPREVRP
jgi:hypothetical protein